MHRTVYTVQKATFCTEVYVASGHRMDSGCCMYCNQNSINIPTLTHKVSINSVIAVQVFFLDCTLYSEVQRSGCCIGTDTHGQSQSETRPSPSLRCIL